MTPKEIRSLLSLHRPGDRAADPRMAEAEGFAQADPELALWWNDEKHLDQLIGAKLDAVHIPAGLKTQIGSSAIPISFPRRNWQRSALSMAAILVAFAVIFGSIRASSRSTARVADFRDEMVSFITLTPSLELQTNNLTRITDFLEKSGAPSQFEIPVGLRDLEPVGCRKLRFRGHDVALVCFKRGGGRLAHLFVVDRAAVASAQMDYTAKGDWMTATWTKGDRTYFLTAQGDRESLQQYLGDS